MTRRLSLLLLALSLVACGDDDALPDTGSPDGGVDAGVDAGPVERIEDLPVNREFTDSALSAPVEAVRDERGMWHIYAATLTDAIRVQGTLQARDRIGQMDFIRRVATGRLAQFAGSFDPSLLQDDIDARFEGHVRNAQAIFDVLSAEERELLEAYSAGVNEHIHALQSGEEVLPVGIDRVIRPASLTDWTPIDTLAIARFQAASLSYDGGDDVNNSEALARWEEYFTAASPAPIARLEGAFHDLFPFQPARRVYNRDGFPNVGTDTGTRARPRPRGPASDHVHAPLASVDAARAQLDRLEARYQRIFGDETRGSNSWVVSGEHTASGDPILNNDPHLSLTSPPLFWQAHVDTKRAGGEINAAGQMIAGTPVSLLGFNEDLAWGLTTSGYDVTDVYLEQITVVDDGPDTVLFEGAQVPIETITEVIQLDLGGTMEVEFEVVPHHGTIIPGSRVETPEGVTALSLAWTGNEPSNEPAAFLELYRSSTAEDARDAFRRFQVGGQTLLVGTREGDIYYTSSVTIPIRPADALTYDPETYEGNSPCFILDGTGPHEWARNPDGSIASVDFRTIPHDLNPARGFIATANADPVGVTDDGNPMNDEAFLGCNFDKGHRLARITERLEELVARGDITPEDMMELQADAQSPYGRFTTPAIVAELDRALEERDTPGTHPDLTAAVMEAGAAMDAVADARDRLMAWSFDTPAGVEDPSTEEIADSIATTIFNLTYSHLMALTFDDEFDWHADGAFDGTVRRTSRAATTMHLMVTEPDRLQSYDAETGESVLWDDISTEVVETRGDRMLRAVVRGLASVGTLLGADVEQWRWGRLHTLRMNAVVPVAVVTGSDPISIPPPGDDMYPDGFPRHGDRDVVDASNFSPFALTGFMYGSGPQQRLVATLTDMGPEAFNAFPGGNSEDPESPFQSNQVDDYIHNRAPAVPFTEAEVLAAAAEHYRFAP